MQPVGVHKVTHFLSGRLTHGILLRLLFRFGLKLGFVSLQ
jgi:hypothetical protein